MQYIKTLIAILIYFKSQALIADIKSGLYFNPNFYYSKSETNRKAQNGESEKVVKNTFILNLNINYKFDNNIIFGLKYYFNDETTYEYQKNSKTQTTATGLNIGYIFNGIHINGSYLILSPPKIAGEQFNKLGKAGFIFDLVYLFKIGNWWFGPQLSFIQFAFTKKLDPQSGKTDEDYKGETSQSVLPFFAIMIKL